MKLSLVHYDQLLTLTVMYYKVKNKSTIIVSSGSQSDEKYIGACRSSHRKKTHKCRNCHLSANQHVLGMVFQSPRMPLQTIYEHHAPVCTVASLLLTFIFTYFVCWLYVLSNHENGSFLTAQSLVSNPARCTCTGGLGVITPSGASM